MDVAVPIGSRFLKSMEVAVIIHLGIETRLAIDSSLHNVLRYIR